MFQEMIANEVRLENAKEMATLEGGIYVFTQLKNAAIMVKNVSTLLSQV